MNFVSSGDTKEQSRGDSYFPYENRRNYTTTDTRTKLNIITNMFSFEQTLSLLKIDGAVSHSYSETDNPNNLTFLFSEFSAFRPDRPLDLQVTAIPAYAVNNLSNTFLREITNFSNFSRDREFTANLNFELDTKLTEDFTGKFKFGGKYRYRTRSFDFEQSDGRLELNSGADVRQRILDAYPWMKETVPNGSNSLPLTLFVDPNFDHGEFLEGDYPIGVPVDIDLMRGVYDIVRKYGTLEAYRYNDYMSKTSDYSGKEYRSAGYAMYTLNLGPDITLIPGIRYENFQTSYKGNRGIQTSTSVYNYVSHDTTLDFTREYWLPMVHLRYKPFDWFDVRFAYTNTLNYPDYTAIIPRIDVGLNSVVWNNYNLKPAQSANYDLYFSFYNNNIGLFTAGGFMKEIKDMIFATNNRYVFEAEDYPGIPSTAEGRPIATTLNNPNKVELWGLEFDWQTHFWYLPGVLSGLVANVNYTHIFSEAKYPLSRVEIQYLEEPPYIIRTVIDTFYTNRFISQPRDIVNPNNGIQAYIYPWNNSCIIGIIERISVGESDIKPV
ncbi:MAG TPA: TonB-dependent receptor, partial [Ignavibacteriales bacterium]|nr:TonB-dependent receptor [Ignavibacteriales bacterium]